jgi:hypothetical protein
MIRAWTLRHLALVLVVVWLAVVLVLGTIAT